ncbi:MAG: tRNA (adenosine(37)-N6)-dimethylallyltransferase MiaA [Desulfocapsa sp.]|nr:tRNA (adenosine(37)-N6)-dimethylallyltransferase MiaA [Desulfocapsa sp.]
MGPTAIGKTALSIQLAQEFDFEIISVDSMQVYRYMDIGTAKISQSEMQGVPHHLIDVVNPDEPFDASLFENLAIMAITDILARGKKVLLTGGTGLYLRALVNGMAQKVPTFPEIRKEIQEQLTTKGRDQLHEQLSVFDPLSAKRIHKNDTHRLVRAIEVYTGTGKPWSELIAEHQAESHQRFSNILILGLRCERGLLYDRIGQRSSEMLDNGLQGEVEYLLGKGYGRELKSMQSIGYVHMVKYLKEEWDWQEMVEYLARDTRRYAKRQFTWFNKLKEIVWIEKGKEQQVGRLVKEFI